MIGEITMDFFIIFPVLMIVLGLLLISIEWSVHVDMVKGRGAQYGRANYKKFVEEFQKVEWERDIYFNNSLFGSDSISGTIDEYHANIIKFNGKGMIIKDPISYLLVKIYVKRYIKQNFEDNRKISEWRQ